MPLQRDTSSAVYWQGAGLDDPEVYEALLMNLAQSEEREITNRQMDHRGLSAAPVTAPSKPAAFGTARPSSITLQVNNDEGSETQANGGGELLDDMHQYLEDDSAEGFRTDVLNAEEVDGEEFTFNPDAELQDAQAEQHGYENAQFYEKVNFGEFSKYMQNKRRKLGVQQGAFKLNAKEGETSAVLKGLRIHVSGRTPARIRSTYS